MSCCSGCAEEEAGTEGRSFFDRLQEPAITVRVEDPTPEDGAAATGDVTISRGLLLLLAAVVLLLLFRG